MLSITLRKFMLYHIMSVASRLDQLRARFPLGSFVSSQKFDVMLLLKPLTALAGLMHLKSCLFVSITR